MNADENPYESPTSTETVASPIDDEQEEKRRYRVAWMWGASGCGYLTLPWWLPPGPPSYKWIAITAAGASLVLSLIVFAGAIGVASLGKPRDIIGALCGAVFGGCFIFFASAAMLLDLLERLLGIGFF